jgi:hypothetical protein
MLLGEMVPKNVALAGPERAAMLLAPPLLGFIRLFRPVIVGSPPPRPPCCGCSRSSRSTRAGTPTPPSRSPGWSRRPAGKAARQRGARARRRGAHLRRAHRPRRPAAHRAAGHRARDGHRRRVEQRVAETGFSRFPVRRRRRPAARLRAPGRRAARPDRGAATAPCRRAPSARCRRSPPTPRCTRCSRCCSAPARTWPRSSTPAGRSGWSRWRTCSRSWSARSATPPAAPAAAADHHAVALAPADGPEPRHGQLPVRTAGRRSPAVRLPGAFRP